jgi:tetratricopeptide (TPR) repeat protein
MMRFFGFIVATLGALQIYAGAAASAQQPSPVTVQPLPAPDLENPEITYEGCLSMARETPERGFEFSGVWLSLGGGEPARHCQAVALIGLNAYGEAATRLEEMAESSNESAVVRAGLLAQAGQAWVLEGEFERAYAAQTAALDLLLLADRRRIAFLIDRASTLASLQKHWEALDDLNDVIAADPDNVDALAFRASAYRYVDALELALEDANRALRVDPDNTAALLERGNIHQTNGERAAARQDWLAAIQLDPSSPAAVTARANIEKLDVKVEAFP